MKYLIINRANPYYPYHKFSYDSSYSWTTKIELATQYTKEDAIIIIRRIYFDHYHEKDNIKIVNLRKVKLERLNEI